MNNSLARLQKLTVVSRSLNSSFNDNKFKSLKELILEVYNAFQNNILTGLVNLTLVNNRSNRSQITTFRSNNMSSLQFLKAENGSLDNLTEILNYPLLKQAELSSNKFEAAANLSHYNLTTLVLSNAKLRGSFSANNLPQLQYLSLDNNGYLQGF